MGLNSIIKFITYIFFTGKKFNDDCFSFYNRLKTNANAYVYITVMNIRKILIIN